MGASESSEVKNVPMTKQQLEETLEDQNGAPSELYVFSEKDIKKISFKIWEKFGKVQRKDPQRTNWSVLVDIGGYAGKKVTPELFSSIVAELNSLIQSDEYPYALAAVPTLKDNYLYVVFRLNNEEMEQIITKDKEIFENAVAKMPMTTEPEVVTMQGAAQEQEQGSEGNSETTATTTTDSTDSSSD